MQKAFADLGSICLVSTTADLELQVDSSVQLIADDLNFTAEELVSNALTFGSTVRPWVKQDNTFKLVVSLDLDLDVEFPDLLQTFAQKLQHSKMWQQLCLQPISVTLSDDSIVTLQISHSPDSERASDQSKYHKLSDGLSYSSMQVHPSIPALQLSTVNLAMCIKRAPVTTRSKVELFGEYGHDKIAPERRRHLRVLVDDTTRMLGDENRSVIDASRPCPDMSAGNMKPQAQRLRNSYHSEIFDQRCETPSQINVLELFDAGIRQAIGARPRRQSRGIRLVSTDSLKPLAKFAPSIWSPGYLAAMSSRSVLLPTISHALNYVGMRNAQSTTLRAKFEEIARRAGHSPARDFSLPNLQKAHSAQSSIGSKLWQAAQGALLKDSSSLRIQVLSTDADRLPITEKYEILDVPLHCEVNFEGWDLEDGMIELDDSGYMSQDNLLSVRARPRSSSPPDVPQETDEEMICT